jgi:hypothetical protein
MDEPIFRRTLLSLAGRSLLSFAVVVVAVSATSLALAGHGHGRFRCPQCEYKVCVPTPTMLKEKKTVFSCECKDICIPAIRGPFAPCCVPPRCGWVRTVKVLKTTEIECEHCGYKWEVQSVGCEPCQK